jgi:hypothetical protein
MRMAARHGPALKAPSPKAGPCSVLIRAAPAFKVPQYRSTCGTLNRYDFTPVMVTGR